MRQSSLIAFNAIIMWLARVLQLFPQLYLVPYLIGKIGNEGYGAYALVWSLLLSVETLQRSLQSGVVKYSAAFLAQGRIDEVNKTVSSSFVFSCVMAIIVSGSLLLFSFIFNGISPELRTPLRIVSVIILLLVPTIPHIAVIQAKQYYYIGAITETLSKYIGLIIILISFQVTSPSVVILIAVMGLMLLLSRAVQVPISYRIVPGLKSRVSLFTAYNFRLILMYGSTIVLASACLAVNSTGIRWLMNFLVSPDFVAHMVIMIMPSILLSQVINPLSVTIMPATSSYEAIGNHYLMQNLLNQGVRYISALVLVGLLLSIFLTRPVLRLWVGQEYLFLSPYAIIIFAGACLRESTAVAHHMLKGLGQLREVVKIYFLCLVIIPVLTIYITFKMYGNPYLAVTAGLTLGNIVCGLLQLSIASKVVKVQLPKLIIRGYVMPIIAALFSYFTTKFVYDLFVYHNNSLTILIVSAMFSALFFLSEWYFLIITKQDKDFFLNLVKSAFRHIKTINR